MLINRTGTDVMLLAKRSRHTDHLAHHTCCTHDTDRSQRHMGHTDVPTCHKQVLYIARVEATVRDRIGVDRDMLCDRLELRTREMLRVLRIGIMQVYAPSGGRRSILMHHMPTQVILFQDIVPHQTTRLPLARDVGHPTQFAISVEIVLLHPILQITPVGIDHQEPIIPDLFKITNLIPVHTGLPRPFTHCHLLAVGFIELNAIAEVRESAGLFGLFGIPLHRGPHGHLVGLFRSRALAELVTRFTPHPVVCSRQIADRTIACAIGKERSPQTQFLARFNLFHHYPTDHLSLHLDIHGTVVGIKRDVGLCRYNGCLLVILIIIGRLCVASTSWSKFLLQIAQFFIGA